MASRFQPVPWTCPSAPLPAALCGAYPEATGPSTRRRLVSQLGANALGEVLEPGRVPDCYLGLRLEPASAAQAAGVLVVVPAVRAGAAVAAPGGAGVV